MPDNDKSDRESVRVDLPRNLGIARRALGLTQEHAADRIGVSVEFYSRIERGHALPSLLTMVAMAQAFDVSIDWLIGRTPPVPMPPGSPPA